VYQKHWVAEVWVIKVFQPDFSEESYACLEESALCRNPLSVKAFVQNPDSKYIFAFA